jgi:hypothetical protein
MRALRLSRDSLVVCGFAWMCVLREEAVRSTTSALGRAAPAWSM